MTPFFLFLLKMLILSVIDTEKHVNFFVSLYIFFVAFFFLSHFHCFPVYELFSLLVILDHVIFYSGLV